MEQQPTSTQDTRLLPQENSTHSEAKKWCPVCEYPIGPDGCDHCSDEQEKVLEAARLKKIGQEDKLEKAVKSLGGKKAYHCFTKEKFVRRCPALEYAHHSAVEFDPDKENLYIFGPTGTGKTHLATIAARTQKKYVPEVLKPQTISEFIRCSADANQEASRIESLQEARLLVIDDIGTEKMTEFLASLIYRIIDGRYMDMRNGLVITSNLDLNQLTEKLGSDRIPSRLAQMCKIISLVGQQDWRVKK